MTYAGWPGAATYWKQDDPHYDAVYGDEERYIGRGERRTSAGGIKDLIYRITVDFGGPFDDYNYPKAYPFLKSWVSDDKRAAQHVGTHVMEPSPMNTPDYGGFEVKVEQRRHAGGHYLPTVFKYRKL